MVCISQMLLLRKKSGPKCICFKVLGQYRKFMVQFKCIFWRGILLRKGRSRNLIDMHLHIGSEAEFFTRLFLYQFSNCARTTYKRQSIQMNFKIFQTHTPLEKYVSIKDFPLQICSSVRFFQLLYYHFEELLGQTSSFIKNYLFLFFYIFPV